MTDLDLFKLQVFLISFATGFVTAAIFAAIFVIPGMIQRYKDRRKAR